MKGSRKGLVILSVCLLLLATLLGGIVSALAGDGETPEEPQSAAATAVSCEAEVLAQGEGSTEGVPATGEGQALEGAGAGKVVDPGTGMGESEAEAAPAAEGSQPLCCPPPQPECEICVVKFLDSDGDGVKDSGETGMAGVTITLNGGNPRLTGQDGRACYEDLEPGIYVVSETVPPGYRATTPTSYEIELCTGSSIQCWMPQPCGETVTVFFGNAPLPQPPGSISGHKYEDLDGDGVHDPGEPAVPGVTVELWQDGAKVADTITGEDGGYSFQELEPGTYTVKEVLCDCWTPTNPADGSHDGVQVDAGQEITGVDFLNKRTECLKGKVEVLVFEDTNCNGQLDDGDSLHPQPVVIELFHDMDGMLIPADGWDGPYQKPTGAGPSWLPVYPHGCSSWKELPCNNYDLFGNPLGENLHGRYQVNMVVPEGWRALTVEWAGRTYTDTFSTFELKCYYCVPTCTWQQVKFLIDPLFHISGHKYEDLDGDGVHDPGEPAVPGVTVELWQDGAKVADTITGEDGSYYFGDLEDGVYEVREVLPAGWYPVSPPDGIHEGVEVGCGDNVEGLDFLNRRHLSISGHKWEDLDRDGAHDPGEPAVPGVTVELWQDGAKVADTVTGEDGSYLFGSLLPGNYTVKEVLPAGWFPTNPSDGSHDNFNLVYGQPIEDLDFHNCRYGSIEGVKFLDLDRDGIMDEGEEGLDGVTIKLNGGWRTAVTAGGGLFSFQDLIPGTYVVAVDESTIPGYYPTGPISIVVELGAGETERVYFGNAPYGSISGHKWLDEDLDGVWDAGETTVIPGITIELWSGSPPEELLETAVTDEDGSYSFPELEPGDYTVVEKGAEGYFPTTPDSVAVELSPGEGAVVDFGNCMYGRITGLVFLDLDGDGVLDEGESGMQGVKITLKMPVETTESLVQKCASAETFTGEDGTFSFVDLLPGDYQVSETVPAGYYATLPFSVEVTLDPGGTAAVIFANAPYASIVGSKWIDDGDSILEPDQDEPGPGFTIKLTGETLDGLVVNMQTVTGEDGTYSFLLLEAGHYTVSEEFDPQKYSAITDKSVDVELAPGAEENVDFLNGVVIVGGEEVNPPTPPTPPAITGGTTALPATGMEQLLLLVAAGVLL
ncbi:SdrD B-like domain-containing protein, partial [Candidatus Solincola tengchongensis]|uniref:SdrD B-like domain-containing protein n=1 Tax=Candidatus Solincola tengchongensis TaxID=2900693 RepID=UPI00257A6D7C